MIDPTPIHPLPWSASVDPRGNGSAEGPHGSDSPAGAAGHSASGVPPPSTRVLRNPALSFELSGGASVVVPAPGCEVTSADGTVTWADAASLEVTDLQRVTLSHNLPLAFDLRSLLGQAIRVTLVDEYGPLGVSQTLEISRAGGEVILVGRFGPVGGIVHRLRGIEVRAALSQRSEGPLVVGTDQLQWLIPVGRHVRVSPTGTGGELVVDYIARLAECVAYVIADSRLSGR
jgi:hypothetical protein